MPPITFGTWWRLGQPMDVDSCLAAGAARRPYYLTGLLALSLLPALFAPQSLVSKLKFAPMAVGPAMPRRRRWSKGGA